MADARTLTLALKGRWHGHYGLAFCPAHANTRTPALSLADGDGGRLLCTCFAGCSFADVMAALRGLGLMEGGGAFVALDRALSIKRQAEAQAMADKKSAQAKQVWAEAVPVDGTIADKYARARAITFDLPDTLRFHPECRHPTGKRHPALVALVEGGAGFAVHRTYLRADGSGKAAVDPPRAMLGAVAGGAVRLTQAEGPLVVAEGIETALSLASGLLRVPATIWATLSTSGMSSLNLPPLPGRLTIATDGDSPGQKAGHELAIRATALGWRVSLLPAPHRRDWNDVLMMKGAAA